MPRWTRWFGLTRRTLRTLERIAAAQEAQTALLRQLAATLAPPHVEAPATPDTGPSFLDELEQAKVLGYIQKMQDETGHVPTDEEILAWLASEETMGLYGARR